MCGRTAKAFRLEALLTTENVGKTAIEQLSSLRTPQGVIGVFRKPDNAPTNDQMVNAQMVHDLVLALDGVQDPGNLGTIIRTCDWFGVRDIFCSLDTADCYSPKVVQATMGALARVRVHYVNLPQWLNAQINDQMVNDQMVNVFGTLLDGCNMYEVLQQAVPGSYSAGAPTAQRSIIVMGNRERYQPGGAESGHPSASYSFLSAGGTHLGEPECSHRYGCHTCRVPPPEIEYRQAHFSYIIARAFSIARLPFRFL